MDTRFTSTLSGIFQPNDHKIIEYDNDQDNANPVQTVSMNLKNDFEGDALLEYYNKNKH